MTAIEIIQTMPTGLLLELALIPTSGIFILFKSTSELSPKVILFSVVLLQVDKRIA